MEHHHHHHEHQEITGSLNNIFIISIVLNLLFVLTEAIVGFAYNSLGLLSDAGHNLSDVFSLLLALFAFRMSRRQGNRHFTYGYKKSTVLASLTNAIILLIAVGAIITESVYKLQHPEPVSGAAVSWTAGVGILSTTSTCAAHSCTWQWTRSCLSAWSFPALLSSTPISCLSIRLSAWSLPPLSWSPHGIC